MAEEKKIENAVYEYDVLEERTERRPAAVTMNGKSVSTWRGCFRIV